MPFSSTVPATAPPSERRLAAALQHRFFLRLHMTAILTGTILVGIITTRLLFAAHVYIFAVRYAIAVIAAWASFIGFVKLWLAYVAFCAAREARKHSSDNWFDSFNFSGSGTSGFGSSSGSSISFSGGGGKFGGGGASGSWDDGSASSPNMAVAAVSNSTSSSSHSLSSSGGHGGGGHSGGGGSSDDLGELVLVLLIIAALVAIVASFLWIVYAAPAILGETAFNAALAGALTPHAHKATHGDWIGSVTKKTALPFVLILILTIATGVWAHQYCPGALRLADALPCTQ